jgi:catechol 2,3-dioxygenase-like lactoylglutathione lyase family enzyme/Tfp pilus assembly protein PilE
MNRFVFVLVIGAACVVGVTTYRQTVQAENARQEAAQAQLAAQDAEREKQIAEARRQVEEAQRQAEEARRRAQEELEKANKALAIAREAAKLAPSEFATSTIDLGTVVADVEKSVKFYTEAVGFKELPGFDVDGDFAKDVGLTNGAALKIHKLVLGEGPGATTLKLMELPKEKPKKNDTQYIHSELGFRYLTIMVADTNAALKRLEKAGIKPIAKTPKEIPESIAKGLWLTIVRDPDGNFVELVGPKK